MSQPAETIKKKVEAFVLPSVQRRRRDIRCSTKPTPSSLIARGSLEARQRSGRIVKEPKRVVSPGDEAVGVVLEHCEQVFFLHGGVRFEVAHNKHGPCNDGD